MTRPNERNLLELFEDPALADFDGPGGAPNQTSEPSEGSAAPVRQVALVVEVLLLVAAMAMLSRGHLPGAVFAAAIGMAAGLLLLPDAKLQAAAGSG